MFRNQGSPKKSINHGGSKGLASKIGIPALAFRLGTLLSSFIGGVGTLFYLIFTSIFKLAKQQLNATISALETKEFNDFIPESYITRIEESAPDNTDSAVTVEHKINTKGSKKQIKIVSSELFFCILYFIRAEKALQNEEKSKNVEKNKKEKQKVRHISSTINVITGYLKLFLISIDWFDNFKIINPVCSIIRN